MAGHSLGEFAALFASGAFSFETGLRLVQRRGTLMAEIDGGGMAAVVGLTESQVQDVLNENGLDAIDIANMNCPTQIVISGRRSDIQKAQKHFVEAGCKGYFDLPVSGAFHSRYMETPKKKFEYFIADFEFMPLSIPVVSNVTARLYEYPHIRQLLSNQIVSSVKWYESIRFIRSQGNIQFKEIGPGNLLTNMLAKIE
jgi:trans-AT polyketide synthase/acyltransferase/oxidoreductase domain-containing protein